MLNKLFSGFMKLTNAVTQNFSSVQLTPPLGQVNKIRSSKRSATFRISWQLRKQASKKVLQELILPVRLPWTWPKPISHIRNEIQ